MVLRTTVDSRRLRVVATGEFSLEAAKRTFLEILEAVARNHCEKVLFDGRRLVGEPTTMQRFYYGEFAADAVAKLKQGNGSGLARQFAYVLEEPVLDPDRLGESVALKRGMNVKAFDNMKDALEWLDNG